MLFSPAARFNLWQIREDYRLTDYRLHSSSAVIGRCTNMT